MEQQSQQIAIEYTVKLEDGTLVDTNVGKAPLVYSKGSHQILPALEQALEGAKQGELKRIKLLPEQAYGKLDPHAFKEVDLESIPENYREPGSILAFQDDHGFEYKVRIHEIKEKTAILDLNHPLAGHVLIFEVKIVNIDNA